MLAERLGRHHVIEQGIMQRHGSGLTITSDDLRRGEAMMYDVTVVIFYEVVGCWLLLLKRMGGTDFFGVEFKPPRFSLSHGSFKVKSPSCSFSRGMFCTPLLISIKKSQINLNRNYPCRTNLQSTNHPLSNNFKNDFHEKKGRNRKEESPHNKTSILLHRSELR